MEKVKQISIKFLDFYRNSNWLHEFKSDEQLWEEFWANKGEEKLLAIEFAEWIERNGWTKIAALPGDSYQETAGWYNTPNYRMMKQPLSTDDLYDLFFSERVPKVVKGCPFHEPFFNPEIKEQ